jgi:hypothetical protein
MQRRLWVVAAVLPTLLGAVGCESPRPSARAKQLPTYARPANTAGLSGVQVDQAAKLCVDKCVRCHPLYDPASYGDAEWQSWVTKMTGKAHLKPGQAELLWRYLGAFRAPG